MPLDDDAAGIAIEPETGTDSVIFGAEFEVNSVEFIAEDFFIGAESDVVVGNGIAMGKIPVE